MNVTELKEHRKLQVAISKLVHSAYTQDETVLSLLEDFENLVFDLLDGLEEEKGCVDGLEVVLGRGSSTPETDFYVKAIKTSITKRQLRLERSGKRWDFLKKEKVDE